MADDEVHEPTHSRPFRRRLPEWLDHFNANDLKIIFRCWVAVWIATILEFVQPALTRIGILTFFASLVLFIVPPAGCLLPYLLAAATLLLGMCLAWAWGLLSMKAALAARPAAETAAKFQALQRTAAMQARQTGQSPSAVASKLVFDGFMLDARVTVVFFVMCLTFIYVLARLRCANQKLILFQIFGTIVIDVFLVIGPSLPSFNAELAVILVKPGAIGIGLGAACSILIFPQSASYAVLRKMEQLIRIGQVALDASRSRFASESVDLKSLHAVRGDVVGVFRTMGPSLAFLPLDVSRGQWNPNDVKALQARVREAMLSCLLLIDFQIAGIMAEKKGKAAGLHRASGEQNVEETAEKDDHNEADDEEGDEGGEAVEEGRDEEALHRASTEQGIEVIAAFKTPEDGLVRTETLRILKNTTTSLLRICCQSTSIAADCIHAVNTTRWKFRYPREKLDRLSNELEKMLKRLREDRESYAINTTDAVLKGHADFFDAHGRFKTTHGPTSFALAGIIHSIAVEEHVIGMARSVERLLEYLLRLMRTRKERQIWIPNRLQQAVNWAMHGKIFTSVAGIGGDDTVDPGVMEAAYTKLQQSQGVTRTRAIHHRHPGHAISSLYEWFINPAGVYALRQVVVTLATAIPAALPHTAGFFYREKGIWAVITAQTCLLFYVADFTFSLISRLLGTIFGGLLALVAWYMGSGHGSGNPYGMAASTGLMILILIWLRVFLPPSTTQATGLGGATFALVIGFSWDQHHASQYGLPGQGWTAFWKRLVTVLLGFLAAIIVQLFPKTPSACGHVRKTLANTVSTLSDHYALILSHWSQPEDADGPLGQAAQRLSLEVAEVLYSLDGSISLIKFEPSTGPFDQSSLKKANDLCQGMNQALGRLLFLSATLPKRLRNRMAETVGFMDDRAIGSIMAVLTTVEQSLRTRSPLPQKMPSPLVKNYLEAWFAEKGGKVELSIDLVRDEEYRRYCIAVSSFLRFLLTLDQLVVALKEVLGESHIVCPSSQEV